MVPVTVLAVSNCIFFLFVAYSLSIIIPDYVSIFEYGAYTSKVDFLNGWSTIE